MAKRKKKNAITMVSLLLLLVVLIGVYVWYSGREPKTDKPEDSNTISVAKIDSTKVKELHYVGKDYEMDFVLTDGVWKEKDDSERPIDQDNVSAIIALVSNINASKVVTDSTSDLASFGLDNPKPSVEVTLEDGSKVTLKVGGAVPTGEGYYALVNNDNKVYLVDNSYGSGLVYTQLSMTMVQKAPEIDPEKLNYLNIDMRDGQDVELLLNARGAKDISGFDTYKWQFLKPYGDGYAADDTEVQKIQQNYASFTYNGCVDYKGEDLAKYGLDKPMATITVGYYVEQASPTPTTPSTDLPIKRYKIYVGNKAEDDNYYIQVDGLKSVYLMDSSKVDAMLKVDTYTLVNKYAALPNILKVDKASVNIDGKSYELDIKTTKTKDTNGDEKSTQTFKFNGKDADETASRDLYKALIGIMYDAPLKEKVDITNKKPILSASFHVAEENKTISVTLLPYNDSFDLIDKGTGIYFLADKRKIDLIIKAVNDFDASLK